VIESHVDDPIYEMKKTLRQLESTDKFLKASICIVNFDELIKSRIIASLEKETSESVLNQRIAEVWTSIKSGTVNPTAFVEDTELMKKRLTQIVDRFGVERIPYAGPECGLRGFPSYGSAMECLRRVSTTIENA
jgi:methionine synthase II (cobalamin-independent)